jgi:hypothetical protein
MMMDNGIIVADFTNRLWRGIKAFSSPPSETPRVDAPTDDDARDIKEFAKPLLGKKGAELGIKHAKYEKQDGEKHIVVEYKFDETELNRAAINIDRKLDDLPALPPPANEEPFREQIKREVMLSWTRQSWTGKGEGPHWRQGCHT